MEKIRVSSYSDIAKHIRDRESFDMRKLYTIAADIHEDAFDLNFSKKIGSNPAETLELENKLKKKRKQFIKKLKTLFDIPFELASTKVFNDIIMAATKI